MKFVFVDAIETYVALSVLDVPLEEFMKFNKIKKNVESVEDIAKALSKSDFLKLSEDRTTVRRVTPIAEATNVDERTIYVVSRNFQPYAQTNSQNSDF